MENNMMPQLRFPEFNGEWVEKKLGEITSVERGKFTPRPRNNPIYYNGEFPFVQTGDVVHSKGVINTHSQTLNKKGLEVSKLFKKGDLLITVAANIGYAGVLQYDMACPDSLIGLKCTQKIKNYFLNYLLEIEQPKMDYLAVAAAQKNINIEFLKPYKFNIPTPPEQTKIATFLTAVDKRINLLQKKKAELEQYKKGVMQKLFSQTIRFKKDDGSYFPDWEEKKLGEVCEKQSSNISANTLSENNGDYKIYGATGYLQNVDFYREEKPYISIIKDGAGVGRTLLCEAKTSVLGTLDIIKPKGKNNLDFLYSLINQINFNKYIIGSTIPHIYFRDYSKEIIEVPDPKEQQKIANFLSSIDKSIENMDNQIDDSVVFKKGLLQKMFV